MKFTKICFCSLLIVLLYSCNNDTKQSKIDIITVDSNTVLALNDAYSGDIEVAGIDSSLVDTTVMKSGKGSIWRLWEKIHKKCQRNEATKQWVYLGVSNTMGVGTVVSRDDSKKKISPEFPIDTSKMSEGDKKLSLNFGNPSSCEYDREVKVNLEFVAKTDLLKTGNSEINAILSNAKDVNFKIDGWRINNLYKSGFSQVVNASTDDFFKKYLVAVQGDAKYIITKEIEISGFSSTIDLKTEISADLKAKLEQGISEKLSNTAGEVKFKLDGEKKLVATSTGKFVVFCELSEAKFIN